jgi:hypothetical protein
MKTKSMNHLFSLILAVGCLFLASCGSDTYKGPVALEEDNLSVSIREAFAAAPMATREMAEKAVTLFEEEKYPESLAQFRKICDLVELTDERRQIASRCLITLTAKIKESADTKQDSNAEKFIRYNHATK